MYVGRDFSPADVGEDEPYAFDFVKDLAAGEFITSATWHCTVADDSPLDDPNAASCVTGDSVNSGSISSQRITGLIENVDYVLQAVVVTNLGNTKSLWAHVRCGVPQ